MMAMDARPVLQDAHCDNYSGIPAEYFEKACVAGSEERC